MAKGTYSLFIVLIAFRTISCFRDWEEYYRSWENDRDDHERIFPFGSSYFDEQASDGGADAEIHFRFPFMGREYKSIYIAQNGYVEFSNTVPATFTDKAPGVDLPDQDHPNQRDVPMIAAWFAFMEDSRFSDGKVFWRRLEPEHETDEERKDISQGMLMHIQHRVKRLLLREQNLDDFHAGIIVTWSDVTFRGCGSSNCATNTVQLALVTDGHSTFALFHMYDLNWVASGLQGCAPDGVPTPENNCVGPQLGFNAGDAMKFSPLPYSRRSSRVLGLSEMSSDGSAPGRYVFEISQEKIIRGGCTNDTYADSETLDWSLEITPEHGNLFGGYDVYFTGPCVTADNAHDYRCQFGNGEEYPVQVAEGEVMPVGKCTVPNLEGLGQVPMRVRRYDGDEEYAAQVWSRTFHSVIPMERKLSDYRVQLDNDHSEWHQAYPESLSFTWEPTALYDRNWNNTDLDPSIVTVRLAIIGYFEWEEKTQDGNTEIKREWKEVVTLDESYPNHHGSFEFSPADYQCTGGLQCEWEAPPPVGMVVVMPQNHQEDRRRLKSQPVPISWHINKHLKNKYGDDWEKPYCEEIFEVSPEPEEWIEDLKPCPPKASQAKAEIGRFMIGPICNESEVCIQDGIPLPHVVHECFHDVTSVNGRARCCYDNEGNIVDALDKDVSSTSDFINPRGILPYGRARHHPILSHWIWDKLYRMACCMWIDDNNYCIQHYNKKRPTPKIQNYEVAGIAVAYGDPHYKTFDGTEFLFNGRGEFWLLRAHSFHNDNDFTIQGRFQQPPETEWGVVNATVISGVALQEGGGNDMRMPRVEFHLNFEDASGDNQLLVYVNGALQDFAEDNLKLQEFTDNDQARRLLIKNNSPEGESKQKNFTVVFENGVAAQVSTNNRAIHLMVVMPPIYEGHTEGLFGIWDGDRENDLTSSTGAVIDSESDPEVIHKDFGMSWEIASTASRFTYRAKLNWEYYRHPDFVPQFVEPSGPSWPPHGTNITEEDVNEACGGEFVCRFDYKTTMSRAVGVESLHTHNWTRKITSMASNVYTCGRPVVDHAFFTYTHYTVAGTVEFTGCEEGYTLQGERTIHCQTSETPVHAFWNPSLDEVECKSDDTIRTEQAKLAAAIAVPICLVAVAAGVAGGYFFMKKRKNSKSGPGERTTPSNTPKPPTDLNASIASSGMEEAQPMQPPTYSLGPQTNPTFGSHTSLASEVSMVGAGDLGMAPPTNASPTPYEFRPISMNPAYQNSQNDIRTTNGSFHGSRQNVNGSQQGINNNSFHGSQEGINNKSFHGSQQGINNFHGSQQGINSFHGSQQGISHNTFLGSQDNLHDNEQPLNASSSRAGAQASQQDINNSLHGSKHSLNYDEPLQSAVEMSAGTSV